MMFCSARNYSLLRAVGVIYMFHIHMFMFESRISEIFGNVRKVKRYEVVTMLIPSRHVTSCTLVEFYCRFEWTYCLHLQDRKVSRSLIKLVPIYRERCFALSLIHSTIETGPLKPVFPTSVAPDLSVPPIGSFRALISLSSPLIQNGPFRGHRFFTVSSCVGIAASFIPLCVLFLPRLAYISTLKMEAAYSSKTSVGVYQTTLHHMPEDSFKKVKLFLCLTN
jgi:hypothetical protein